MSNNEYEKEIRKAAEGEKIACKEAMKLAGRLGITFEKMGQLLNEYKIKIRSCQLGCFD